MRILLVDEDHLFTRLLKLKLEKWGHKVHIELTGVDAWEELQRQAYRVVIMELNLPGIDGPEICRRIRKLNRIRYTYVLFFSRQKDHDSITAAYRAGADDYMTKPLNPQLLQLRLKNGKRLLNLEDELRTGASYDATTGFIKYETFLRIFKMVVSGAERYKYSGVVSFVTIANYQAVYESAGYGVAIRLKEMVADILTREVRAADLIANIGGDSGEFAILMPYADEQAVLSQVRRIKKRFKSVEVAADGKVVHPEIVYHMAVFPRDGLSADELLAPENRQSGASESAA